jgi:hypothetical protein
VRQRPPRWSGDSRGGRLPEPPDLGTIPAAVLPTFLAAPRPWHIEEINHPGPHLTLAGRVIPSPPPHARSTSGFSADIDA